MMKGVYICYECLARERGFTNAHDFLKDFYWNRMMTPKEIAIDLGRSVTSIMNALHYYKVKIRPKGSGGRPTR
jgi:hypothetical protein